MGKTIFPIILTSLIVILPRRLLPDSSVAEIDFVVNPPPLMIWIFDRSLPQGTGAGAELGGGCGGIVKVDGSINKIELGARPCVSKKLGASALVEKTQE